MHKRLLEEELQSEEHQVLIRVEELQGNLETRQFLRIVDVLAIVNGLFQNVGDYRVGKQLILYFLKYYIGTGCLNTRGQILLF